MHRLIAAGLSLAGLAFPLSARAAQPQHGRGAGGDAGAGISDMWDQICTAVPFCNKVAQEGGPSQAVLSFAQQLVNLIYPLLSVMAVLMIIYAGIKVVLSQGNDDGISSAKDIIKYALIGVVLGILAKEILDFVIVVLNTFI